MTIGRRLQDKATAASTKSRVVLPIVLFTTFATFSSVFSIGCQAVGPSQYETKSRREIIGGVKPLLDQTDATKARPPDPSKPPPISGTIGAKPEEPEESKKTQ